MAWQSVIMYAVVAGAIPAAFRNITALAMVIAWLSVELVYQITGDNLPLQYSFMADIFVLAVVFAKPEVCDLSPYRNTWHQLKAVLLERSVTDRIVMLIFPVMWFFYAVPIHPYYTWYALWALVIIQFLAAGYEGYAKLIQWWCARKTPTPIIDRHLCNNVVPLKRRAADAVRKAPEHSDALLTAAGGGSG